MRRRVFLVKGLLMTSAAASLISLLESCSVAVESTAEEAKAGRRAPKTGKAACAARGTAADAFFHTHPVGCVTIDAIDKGAGVALTLTTGFTHQVSLSPSQLLELTRGESVESESSWTLFHTHMVTFQRV